MVALFFVPVVVVVVVVVVVAIAERKRESVCEKEKQVRGIFIQTERRKREKGTQKQQNQKGTQKLFPFPSPPLCSLFRSLFCLSEVNERERTEVNERKEE
jgi:hypothetical protein